MSRKPRIAAAVAALAIALSACGGSSSDSSATSDTATSGSTPIESAQPTFQPISAGKLTVCSDVPYPPFEFQDDAGKWTGFDIDVISAVAQRYGLAVEVSKQPFDSILVAVGAGTCDVVASAVTITDERKKNVLFSDPYFDADQSLLVRTEDAETYVDLASLAGKTIAVQTGTTGESYAKKNAGDAKIQSFDDPAAMFLALESKQVDAVLQDLPVNVDRANKQDAKTKVTATFPTGEQYGFAIAKTNDALQTDINEALNIFRSSGTYDEIYKKYFGAVNG
ncbi:MAG: hypothetical protein RLZZ544_961 [Actinomycetota bacterium]